MIYFIADAAADPTLYDLIAASPDHACLFAGRLSTELARNAPYLVGLGTDVTVASAWRSRGRGRNWGIFCSSERGLSELRRDLRKFLQAKLPDGRIVLFRFYDPRVWSAYIKACPSAELGRWFFEVQAFYAEAEGEAALHEYRLVGGELTIAAVGMGSLST